MAKKETKKVVAVLPVIVTRRFTEEGAVLAGVTLESADWKSYFKGTVDDWDWSDIMDLATNDTPYTWFDPESEFIARDGDDSKDVHVTMVYPLFIDKRSSDLIDTLDSITDASVLFEGALRGLLNIRNRARKSRSPIDSPFQIILNYIASCVARFQIPQVIPYGKSEKDFWPTKWW